MTVKLAEHTGGGGPLQKWGRGAPSRAGEGIDRDAGIGPPLSCERVRGGAGGPAPSLRWWREPFSEKPKPPRTFKSAASASSPSRHICHLCSRPGASPGHADLMTIGLYNDPAGAYLP